MSHNRGKREKDVTDTYDFVVFGGEYSIFNAGLIALDTIITGGSLSATFLQSEVAKIGIDLGAAMANASPPVDPIAETLYTGQFVFNNWETVLGVEVPLPNKFVPYVAARKKQTPQPQLIDRFAEGFGHAKNARLKFEGKVEEPMAGHINWCMSQSTEVCRAQILDELRMLEIGFNSNGLNCEGFGHLKNAHLTLSEGRIEPLEGHSKWCRTVSAEIAIHGLKSYISLIKEELEAQYLYLLN